MAENCGKTIFIQSRYCQVANPNGSGYKMIAPPCKEFIPCPQDGLAWWAYLIIAVLVLIGIAGFGFGLRTIWPILRRHCWSKSTTETTEVKNDDTAEMGSNNEASTTCSAPELPPPTYSQSVSYIS